MDDGMQAQVMRSNELNVLVVHMRQRVRVHALVEIQKVRRCVHRDHNRASLQRLQHGQLVARTVVPADVLIALSVDDVLAVEALSLARVVAFVRLARVRYKAHFHTMLADQIGVAAIAALVCTRAPEHALRAEDGLERLGIVLSVLDTVPHRGHVGGCDRVAASAPSLLDDRRHVDPAVDLAPVVHRREAMVVVVPVVATDNKDGRRRRQDIDVRNQVQVRRDGRGLSPRPGLLEVAVTEHVEDVRHRLALQVLVRLGCPCCRLVRVDVVNESGVRMKSRVTSGVKAACTPHESTL